jgi:predicted RNA-binding protein with PIN domain
MRYLIDGYNLMYAGGLLGEREAPAVFRRVRTRFLNDLAHALGPLEATQSTVVFDASGAPEDAAAEVRHNGVAVVYAVDDESADDRIERLIAGEPTPKTLIVVSSDRRLRQAAARRRAKSVSAEDFWVMLDSRKEPKPRPRAAPTVREPRDEQLSADETRFWLEEFADLSRSPEVHEDVNPSQSLLTDAEIAEIEREVESEPD